MKSIRLVAALLAAFFCAVSAEAAQEAEKKDSGPAQWVNMPAGARKTYIGVQGGTVPVSLLTAGDGSPMIARVGLTGSDFLHFLRSGGKLDNDVVLFGIMPSTDPALETSPQASSGATRQAPMVPPLPSKNATVLLAGTAAGDVPVIYATGRTFEDMSLVPANWAPFGLTEKPLSAEGSVKVILPEPKKARRTPRS